VFYEVRLYHRGVDVDLDCVPEETHEYKEQLAHDLISAPTWSQALSVAMAKLREALPDDAAYVNWFHVALTRKDARNNENAQRPTYEGGIP